MCQAGTTLLQQCRGCDVWPLCIPPSGEEQSSAAPGRGGGEYFSRSHHNDRAWEGGWLNLRRGVAWVRFPDDKLCEMRAILLPRA